MDEGHDGDFESRLPVGSREGAEYGMSDGAIGKHGMQHGRELVTIVVVEEAQEIYASELLAELLADFGAGEAEAESERTGTFGNEGLR
jgi:hypothetical protein